MLKTKNKYLKQILIFFGSIIGILLFVQLGVYIYFQNNKEDFKEKIISLLSEEINGNIAFEDIDISFYKNFPTTAILIDKLTVSDSLFSNHNINAIELDQVYLKVDAWSILHGDVLVRQLTLTDGKIHFFTDNSNYTNLRIFPTNKKQKESQNLKIKKIKLEKVQLFVEDRPKKKKFNLLFEKMQSTISRENSIVHIKSKIEAKVGELNFNEVRGGFMVDKDLTGQLNFTIDQDNKTCKIEKSEMVAGGEALSLNGNINKIKEDIFFNLAFHAPNGNYKNLLTSLPIFYQKKLNKASVKNDIDIKAYLNGKFNYPDTPALRVLISTENNEIVSDAGTFSKVSFEYEFYNFLDSTKGRTDENTYISFKNLSATWKNIPFSSEKLTIVNLNKPFLKVDITSQFKSELLSAFTEGTMTFKKGNTAAAITYKGPLLERDTRKRSLDGTLALQDAEVKYLPYQATFTDCNAKIEFKGSDVIFRNINLQRKQDVFNMQGEAKRFLNYYFNDPGKIAINWNVQAQQLHLENYINFINRQRSTQSKTTKKLSKVSKKLADFTDKSTMNLSLKLNNIYYQNFSSKQVVAKIALLENAIAVREAKLNFGHGTITLAGKIAIDKALKNFNMKTKVQNIDIPDLLTSCNNFGQPTFCKDNITGKINLDAQLNGKLNKDASLKPNSLFGKLNYNIQEGALVDFEPLEKIEKYILRSRDLTNLEVRNLAGQLIMKKGLVSIPITEVNTNAFTIFMQGTYGIKSGTDMALLIPLRNPKKDEIKESEGIEVDKKRGLKIYLQALDDKDGKVQFSWLKRADRPSFKK